MSKDQVAEVLIGIATLLELNGENPFKTRAYLNAARTIETMSEPLDKVVAEGRLGEMKGIGEGIRNFRTSLKGEDAGKQDSGKDNKDNGESKGR